MRRWVNVVIAGLIVLLIAALAMSALTRVREVNSVSMCRNNLRSIALGLSSYHDTYRRYPLAALPNADLPPEHRLSWQFEIDPFLHARMDPEWTAYRKEAWDSPRNLNLVRQPFPWLICPMSLYRATTEGYTITTYIGVTGLGRDAAMLPKEDPRAGFFGYERKLREADMTDGLATTIAVIETGHDNGPWMAGGWPTTRGFDRTGMAAIGRGSQFGGFHRGGANVLFTDGSVRFLANGTDPEALSKLVTVISERD